MKKYSTSNFETKNDFLNVAEMTDELCRSIWSLSTKQNWNQLNCQEKKRIIRVKQAIIA